MHPRLPQDQDPRAFPGAQVHVAGRPAPQVPPLRNRTENRSLWEEANKAVSHAGTQISHYCLRPSCLLCDGRFHTGLLAAHVSVAQKSFVRKAQFLFFFPVCQHVQMSTDVSGFDLTTLPVALRWSRGQTLSKQNHK